MKHARLANTRLAGGVMVGALAAVIAVASGTALASSGSSAQMGSMSGMTTTVASSHNRVGFTKGWYRGRTVRFYYTRNFFCKAPPASKASSKCEAGTNYTQTPASDFDPLYVVVPLGFTPSKRTLQCPAGRCIDHPRTIDLSAVLGSGTGNVLLPAHSHIVATNAGHQSEWWNVDVVGVKAQWAWNRLVSHKGDGELQRLQRRHSNVVTGNIPTNLFLYFAVLR